MYVQNVMAIYPIAVKIFQSGPKGWNNQLTNIAIPRAMTLVWLKKSALRHECEMFMILPRKSNLVLLTDTGAGLVGAEELSSLVGVSCCNETEQSGFLLLYLTRSLNSQLLEVWEIPDQKDRL